MLEFLDNEEQTIVLAAREFARDRLLELDRSCDRNESSICSVLPQLAEMGFMTLRVPEEFGGLGCRRLTYAAILHEIAYASPSASITLGVHNMVGEMLLRFGTARVRNDILLNWGRAESHGAFAVSEADVGSDPAAASTMAVNRNGEWILNGSKMWITSGHWGRWFVVLAQTRTVRDKSGLCVILVDGRQEGFERAHIRGKMGIRASETLSLHLTNVRAPLDHLLGEPGCGLKVALSALDGGRIGVAAQSTGMAAACLDEMIGYSRQRIQFGRPIARFQAIQDMIAQSRVELDAAKMLIAQACHLADRGTCYTAAASQAKLYASEMVGRVADRAVQVHGGAGYVHDSRVEQLYRDARVVRIYEGTSEVQRLIIARKLLEGQN